MATAANIITSARYDLRAVTGQSFEPEELLEYLNRSVIILDGVLMSTNSDWLHQTAISSGLTAGLNKVTMPTRCISIRSVWVTDIIDSFTDLTYTAAADTIATAAGTFTTNGLAANETIGIIGSTSNNTNINGGDGIGLLTISAVTETLITVNEDVIVDEGAANASGTIMQIKNLEVEKLSTNDLYVKRKWISATGRPFYWAWEGTSVIFDYKADQAYGLLFHFNRKSAVLQMSTTMPYNGEFDESLREGLVMFGKQRRGEIENADIAIASMIKQAVMTKATRRNHIPERYRLDF